MPGTRAILCRFSQPRNRRGVIAAATCSRCAAEIPACQVVITRKTSAPKLSGTHPPSAIFNRLAAKNTTSTKRKIPLAARATGIGHFHRARASGCRATPWSASSSSTPPCHRRRRAARSCRRSRSAAASVISIISQLIVGTYNLAVFGVRGLADVEAGKPAELHRLAGQRKRAG